MRIFALCVFVASMLSSARAEEPFDDLTFEQACKEAKKTGKIVMIDYYTTWCAPCKLLDATTLKNPDVIALLKKRTISLKIDAEKERELSARHRITGYPTLVFLKPEGTEINRIVGYIDAKAFLAQAEGLMSGKDALERARDAVSGEQANNPMARMNYARELEGAGRDREALDQYLWCFDEGAKLEPQFAMARLSILLMNIARMAQSYPPAKTALVQRRDRAEQVLLSGTIDSNALDECATLNQALNEPLRILRVYDKLKGAGDATIEARRAMFFHVAEPLITGRRFGDFLEAAGDIHQRLDLIQADYRTAAETKPQNVTSEQMRQQYIAYLHRRFAAVGGLSYEALLGVGQSAAAGDVADKILTFDGSWQAYDLLLRHARRAGSEQTVQTMMDRARNALPPEEYKRLQAQAIASQKKAGNPKS